MTEPFAVKDSGERKHFDSGMQRDTSEGKIDYSLVFDGPLVRRLAAHMTKGAAKYNDRNWLQATGMEEYERFRQSACRHFVQYLDGEEDEDHFAAVVFNMNGMEFVKERMERGEPYSTLPPKVEHGEEPLKDDPAQLAQRLQEIADMENALARFRRGLICDCDTADNISITNHSGAAAVHGFSERFKRSLSKGAQAPKQIG